MPNIKQFLCHKSLLRTKVMHGWHFQGGLYFQGGDLKTALEIEI
jgi:hypothetical protein